MATTTKQFNSVPIVLILTILTVILFSSCSKNEPIAEIQSGGKVELKTTMAASEIAYEAEQATLNGAVVASNQSGYSGTGFVDYVNTTGDFIEWTVNVLNAGFFSLEFKYANGGTTNRPLKLDVNGVTILTSLNFLPTSDWKTWKRGFI